MLRGFVSIQIFLLGDIKMADIKKTNLLLAIHWLSPSVHAVNCVQSVFKIQIKPVLTDRHLVSWASMSSRKVKNLISLKNNVQIWYIFGIFPDLVSLKPFYEITYF